MNRWLSFFVDSCVFFAYAYPEEKWNSKCISFFGSKFTRFTGIRVKNEIERRLHKRKELYKKVAKFLANGCKLSEFDTRIINNANDRKHFENLLLILAKEAPEEVLSYIRDKDNVTRKGISDALKRIQHPLVGKSFDPLCEDIIQVLIDNRIDAQIFVDAFYWSEKTGESIFATLDVTDFIKNRSDIHKAMCKYKLIDCVEKLPLKILHVAEIV
jgi:hypothetical protein